MEAHSNVFFSNRVTHTQIQNTYIAKFVSCIDCSCDKHCCRAIRVRIARADLREISTYSYSCCAGRLCLYLFFGKLEMVAVIKPIK